MNRVMVVLGTATLAATLAATIGVDTGTSVSDLQPGTLEDVARATDGGDALLRAVYKHSVVPGGIYDTGELLAVVKRDPVVAAHYSAMSLRDARVEHVAEPRRVYVSYRIGDRIYWTKRTVSLNAGEAIITDGTTQIRARCGNCISLVPMQPTLEAEPALEELDQALTTPDEPALAAADPALPLVMAPAPAVAALDPALTTTPALDALEGELGLAPPAIGGPLAIAGLSNRQTSQPEEEPTPPGDDPGDPGDPGDPEDPPYVPPDPPVNPPVSVPEPGSLLLLSTGLAAYAIRRRVTRGRSG
jgi:hypothetical protein